MVVRQAGRSAFSASRLLERCRAAAELASQATAAAYRAPRFQLAPRLPIARHASSSTSSPSTSSTTTTSTSLDPLAPALPLNPTSNPHASTPSASAILTQPSVRQERQPSPFILASMHARTPPPPPPLPQAASPLPPSVVALLPSLAAQKPHYLTVHIHGRPYLITAGDRVRLPFLMRGVQPGDVLRLTRASVVGSRDFTLRGSPWVDDRLFVARAVVAGVESEPMRVMEKTKRRNRRVKRVMSKHRYTELLVCELQVNGLEEVARVEGARLEAGKGDAGAEA